MIILRKSNNTVMSIKSYDVKKCGSSIIFTFECDVNWLKTIKETISKEAKLNFEIYIAHILIRYDVQIT